MKSIIFFPIFLLLTSCLFVEGSVIKEPEDIVVTDSVTKFAIWDRCGLVDVSKPDADG